MEPIRILPGQHPQESGQDVDVGWPCPILRHPDRYPFGERPMDCPADEYGIIPPALLAACSCRGPAGIYPD